MKYRVFLGLSLLAVAGALSAQQAVVDSSKTALDAKIEVYRKENIPFKKPIPFPYVREADVTQQWTVWRMIMLNEKQNLVLYYPTANIGSRMNLINILLKGIESGELKAYDPNDDHNEFAREISMAEIDQYFGAKIDTIEVSDEYGNMVRQIRETGRKTDEIKRLLIKEHWYFDRKHSVLNCRVVGICPIRVYLRDGADEDSRPEMMKTMWIYMPEARNILARHPVYNRFNDAQNISFDDFFMQNRYDGMIYKISNVYNNREINEYASGLDALYEAQRLHYEIFDWEQDLWEY